MIEDTKLHWIMENILQLMKEKDLTFQGLEDLIQKEKGTRIPANTLKYWAHGKSSPKLNELDMIVDVLGYELELMLKEDQQDAVKDTSNED